jgi:hypothetical protein
MGRWHLLLSCIVNPPPLSSDVLGTPIVLEPFARAAGWLLLCAALALCGALLVLAARPLPRARQRGRRGWEGLPVAWPIGAPASRWRRQLAGVIRRSRLECPTALLVAQGPGTAGSRCLLENDVRRAQIARRRRRRSS